ncbi:MAG: RNA polymerase factor sigma-54 [Bacteroidales bacterium]|nr:RNA polymerase factor sigma-54 [Bacteroidales bacterium]
MPTKLSQQQKTVQRQIATQQTIRLMQLVELPYASLEQEIQKEVDENPALEAYLDDVDERVDALEENPSPEYDENGDPLDLSQQQLSDEEIFKEDYYRDDDLDDYPTEREIENRIRRLNAPEESGSADRMGVFHNSMQEQWQLQLGEMNMTERELLIAQYLTGNLDDDGYFTMDMQAVVNEMLYMNNLYTNVEEVEEVLTRFVQELDPPGVGARNLRECLLLQIRRLPHDDEDVKLAEIILDKCFEQFAKKHYDKIQQMLSISEEQLKRALAVIRKLDPRPADSGSPLEKNADVIRPDFTITANNGKLSLTLNNQYVSKVRINKEFSNAYRFLTKEASEKKRAEAERFMREYVERGEQFIGILTTREMILYNTMYAIMQHQKAYFLSGDDADLKPMILKTIAQEVKLDVSTVSRVSNSKYVQTDFGVIPLKHLFSEAVNDEDVSSKEIKRILTDLIEAEDKKSPLADEKLCDLLKERGYNIARRTVAKYREQLDIPVARLRKEI